ncbi:hypothetical protein CROQUDRAFT_54051, partial [Cronartium quercuum f. sp. fusiforme G11]
QDFDMKHPVFPVGLVKRYNKLNLEKFIGRAQDSLPFPSIEATGGKQSFKILKEKKSQR